ncbi:hypothetical protein [Carnobacterium maltaromaticum]|uniref:hypothetical protein n=1 Tax=Carnobacterium maltaromaticum TaxID=2751 RepID=UPI0039AF730B
MPKELKYEEYPKSCPPLNSKEIDGEFYRICKTDPPTKDDFLCQKDLGRLGGRKFPPAKECGMMALSFYDNLENLKETMEQFPKLGEYIYIFIISKNAGVTTLNNNHLLLWEYKNVDIFSELKNTWRKENDDDETNIEAT